MINDNGKTVIQDLFPYNFDATPWKSNTVNGASLAYQCDDWIIGGQKITTGAQVYRKYTGLPPHNSIILKVRLYFVDSWDGEPFFVYADGVQVYSENWRYTNIASQDICGNPSHSDQVFDRETLPFEHMNSELTLLFNTTLNAGPGNENMGFNCIQIVLSDCHHTCYTCTSSAANKCLSCPTGKYLNPDGTCQSTCPSSSYVMDSTTGTCIKCYQSSGSSDYRTCNTCSERLSTNCKTCNAGNYLDEAVGACLINCPAQTYPNSGKCLPCYSPSSTSETALACATCNGPAKTDCVTCPQGTYKWTDSSCIRACPNGYYSQTSPLNICIKCDGTCATCNGGNSNNCLTCDVPYYLETSTSKCISTCPSGYWPDSVTRTCKLCYQAVPLVSDEQTCFKCTQGTSRDCTACVAGTAYLYPLNGTCLLNCPSGWWADTSSNECKQCYQYTTTAPTKNTCATCDGSNSNNCLSCTLPLFLDATTKTCVSSCPSGYWGNSANARCTLCYQATTSTDINKNCKTCSGPLSTNCLTCLAGNYYFASNQTCLGGCPPGFFADSTTSSCIPCYVASDPTVANRTCVTCDGPFSYNCLTCEQGNVLVSNTCFTSCPSGTYFDISTNLCENCFQGSSTSEACQTCAGPLATDCSSCFAGAYLLPTNRTCVSQCPVIGWYAGVDLCLSCYYPTARSIERGCLSCKGGLPTDCLRCVSGTYFYALNSTCLLDCPYGYFQENNTFSCILCTNSSVPGCPEPSTSATIGALTAATNTVNAVASISSVFLLGGLTIPSVMAISFPADVAIFIYLYVGFSDDYVQFTRGLIEGQNTLNPFPHIRGETQIPTNATVGMFKFWEISTVLLENSGFQITKEVSTLLIIGILSLIALICKSCPKIENGVKKMRDTLRWNGLLSFVIQDFSNVLLNSMIQMRENNSESTYAYVSMGIASLEVTKYALLIPFIVYILNRKVKSEARNGALKVRAKIPETLKTLSEGFKDNYWVNRNFALIFILQYVVAIITVFFVQELGYIAPTLYMTTNIIYLVALLGFRPLKSRLKMGVILFNQLCKNTMAGLALALGANQISQETRDDIGTALIILTITGCVVDCLFSLVFLTISVFELLTTSVRKKRGEGLNLLEAVPSLNSSGLEQDVLVPEGSGETGKEGARKLDTKQDRGQRKYKYTLRETQPSRLRSHSKSTLPGLRPVLPGTRKLYKARPGN